MCGYLNKRINQRYWLLDMGKQKMSEREEIKGHTDEVLALALSGDGKYLASGGKDRRLGVWDVEKEEWVRGFGGHKDLISVGPYLTFYFFHRLKYTLGPKLSKGHKPALHCIP